MWLYQKLVMSKWKMLRRITSIKQDVVETQYLVFGIVVARMPNRMNIK